MITAGVCGVSVRGRKTVIAGMSRSSVPSAPGAAPDHTGMSWPSWTGGGCCAEAPSTANTNTIIARAQVRTIPCLQSDFRMNNEHSNSPPQPRRGGCAIKKRREATIAREDGLVLLSILDHPHPVRSNKEAPRRSLEVAATPPRLRRGVSQITPFLFSHADDGRGFVEAPFLCGLRRSQPRGVTDRRIRAILQQQFGHLDGTLIIIGKREQRHLVSTRDRGGKRAIRRKQLGQAIDSARETPSPNISTERREDGNHFRSPLIVGTPQRSGIVVPLDRVNIGAAGNQSPCDLRGAALCSDVESTHASVIGHVRRCSHLQQ